MYICIDIYIYLYKFIYIRLIWNNQALIELNGMVLFYVVLYCVVVAVVSVAMIDECITIQHARCSLPVTLKSQSIGRIMLWLLLMLLMLMWLRMNMRMLSMFLVLMALTIGDIIDKKHLNNKITIFERQDRR